jgi:hypothetical protein
MPGKSTICAALDWAFSPGGDESIGVALTAAAVPLWISLSLLEECRRRAKQGLDGLATGGPRNPREEMRLHAALGASTADAEEMGAAFTNALEVAEGFGDSEYQLRALRGLYFHHVASGRYRIALQFAQKFYDLAVSGSEPSDKLVGERLIGAAQHYLGDQRSARHRFERVLSEYLSIDRRINIIRFQAADLRPAARTYLARV